jgi:hypothetical protein
MERVKMTEAEKWGAIYRKLQQIDENRKFRKTIDKRQITLEQCIAKNTKKTLQ